MNWLCGSIILSIVASVAAGWLGYYISNKVYDLSGWKQYFKSREKARFDKRSAYLAKLKEAVRQMKELDAQWKLEKEENEKKMHEELGNV